VTGGIEVHALELPSQRADTPPFEIVDTSTRTRKSAPVPLLVFAASAPERRPRPPPHPSDDGRYFDEGGFLELDTPVMVKYTPGGARNSSSRAA